MWILIMIEQIALLVVGMLIHKGTEKKIFIIFNVYWVGLLILLKIVPFGGYAISNNTFIMIMLFLFFINLGFLLGGKKRESDNASIRNEVERSYEYAISNKLVCMYLILSMLFLIYYAVRYYIIVQEVGGVEARNIRYFVGPLFRSTPEILFYNYIIVPSKYLSCFFIAYGFFRGRFKCKELIVPGIVLILSCYIGGGRMDIVYLLFAIVFAFLFKERSSIRLTNKGILWKKRGLIIVLLGIVASVGIMLAMIYLTAYRSNQYSLSFSIIGKYGVKLFEHVVGYNIGPFGALDVAIQEGILKNKWYVARSTIFGGIEEVLQYFMSYLGVSFVGARNELGMVLNQPITVGNLTFNALLTALCWFYSDLGILGIVIYSFLFGFLVRYSISKFYNCKNVFVMAILFHLLYQYMVLNLNWYLVTVGNMFYVIGLFYLSKQYGKWRRHKGFS